MKSFLLSLFLAGAAFGQIQSPGVFGLLRSEPLREKLTIPMRDVANFSYISYVNLQFRQFPNSLVNSCQVWVDTPLLVSDGPRVWLLNADLTDWLGPYKLGSTDIDPVTHAVIDRKLNNGICVVNVTRTALVPDPLVLTDGKLELHMEYLVDTPAYLYAVTQPYSTLKLSVSRMRPLCPPHAQPGQWPDTGCPE